MRTVKTGRYMCILEKTVLQTRDSPNFIHFVEINFWMFEGDLKGIEGGLGGGLGGKLGGCLQRGLQSRVSKRDLFLDFEFAHWT